MVIVSKNAFNMDVSRQNQNSASTAQSITNNINVISRTTDEPVTAERSSGQQPELVGAPQPDIQLQYNALLRENRALRLILEINKSNPLIINDFIVAPEDKLSDLIQALTDADEIEISSDEYVAGCLTKNRYRKILSIYVKKGDVSENFKYSHADANKLLNDEKISIKYVY